MAHAVAHSGAHLGDVVARRRWLIGCWHRLAGLSCAIRWARPRQLGERPFLSGPCDRDRPRRRLAGRLDGVDHPVADSGAHLRHHAGLVHGLGDQLRRLVRELNVAAGPRPLGRRASGSWLLGSLGLPVGGAPGRPSVTNRRFGRRGRRRRCRVFAQGALGTGGVLASPPVNVSNGPCGPTLRGLRNPLRSSHQALRGVGHRLFLGDIEVGCPMVFVVAVGRRICRRRRLRGLRLCGHRFLRRGLFGRRRFGRCR
mmetsp:Transcript_8398/g.24137  ORF Transcript_8398/g.24137 Transcript_8398/m.24137 type:complete len:255 (+) Transcript_8398:80-844(+)